MKNPAYGRARVLLKEGEIKDFQGIAIIVQKKALARDLRMHFDTLQARIIDPGKWTIHQLAELSDLMEIDHGVLVDLADRLRVQKKRGKK